MKRTRLIRVTLFLLFVVHSPSIALMDDFGGNSGGVSIGGTVSGGGVSGGVLYENSSGGVAQDADFTHNGTTTAFNTGWLSVGNMTVGGDIVGNISIFSRFEDSEEPKIQFIQDVFGTPTTIGEIFNDADSTHGDANALVLRGDNNLTGRIVIGAAAVSISPSLTIEGAMLLTPQASPPGSPTSGVMYMDSSPTPDELCVYDGTGWQALITGTDGNCA